MSDYIDREKFIKLLVNRDLREISTKTIGECLDKAEVVDVVEVKHGHWVFCGVVDDIYGHGASCSVCGGYTEDNGYYCSCCGAKMDDALQRKTNPEAFKGGDDYE